MNPLLQALHMELPLGLSGTRSKLEPWKLEIQREPEQAKIHGRLHMLLAFNPSVLMVLDSEIPEFKRSETYPLDDETANEMCLLVTEQRFTRDDVKARRAKESASNDRTIYLGNIEKRVAQRLDRMYAEKLLDDYERQQLRLKVKNLLDRALKQSNWKTINQEELWEQVLESVQFMRRESFPVPKF